jgi:hypothetical protein
VRAPGRLRRPQSRRWTKFFAYTCLVATIASHGGNLSAGALDALQGNWGASGTPCDQVFSVKDGKLSLRRDVFGASGFIVNGKRFEGPNADCSLISLRRKSDAMTIALDCRMQVIFDTVIVSVRMLDPDTLVRFHPEFPGLDMQYLRCKPG